MQPSVAINQHNVPPQPSATTMQEYILPQTSVVPTEENIPSQASAANKQDNVPSQPSLVTKELARSQLSQPNGASTSTPTAEKDNRLPVQEKQAVGLKGSRWASEEATPSDTACKGVQSKPPPTLMAQPSLPVSAHQPAVQPVVSFSSESALPGTPVVQNRWKVKLNRPDRPDIPRLGVGWVQLVKNNQAWILAVEVEGEVIQEVLSDQTTIIEEASSTITFCAAPAEGRPVWKITFSLPYEAQKFLNIVPATRQAHKSGPVGDVSGAPQTLFTGGATSQSSPELPALGPPAHYPPSSRISSSVLQDMTVSIISSSRPFVLLSSSHSV